MAGRRSLLLMLTVASLALVYSAPNNHRHHGDGGGFRKYIDTHLPRDVTPTSYHLQIQPLMEEDKFIGHVTISLECQEDTDKITLHAHPQLSVNVPKISLMSVPKATTAPVTQYTPTEAPTVAPVPVGAARLLPVSSSFVPENTGLHHDEHHSHHEDLQEMDYATTSAPEPESTQDENPPKGVPLAVSRAERNIEKQWLVIYVEEHLQRGELYVIHLQFSGELTNDPKNGVYLETYTDLTSREKRAYVATHMQQENARKVFPCFDEPSYKVPMNITIVAPREYTVLTSTMEESAEERGDWAWHKFYPTPPMATFSFSFTIFHLHLLVYDVDAQVRIFGRKELEELPNTEKALQIAVRAIEEIKDYLDSPLPLGKLDFVVLPGSHSSAESNWGLIFLRESRLTYQHCLGQQITRDVAMQWMGHLVSPHWWDTAPINKALSSFIAFSAELRIDNTTSTSSRMWSMNYPLYYEFGKRKQYTQSAFLNHPHRPISFELVLRMFNYTLGGSFKLGVRSLVNQRSYKTYQTEDVWSSLTLMVETEDILPEPGTVNQIAFSWLSVPRVPYVKVTRDYDKHSAEVEQHSFFRDVVDDEPESADALWWIPLVVVSQNNLNFDNLKPVVWMEEETRVNLRDLSSSNYFIIVNPEEVGPFIVNYDRKNWFLISEYLDRNINNEQIPAGTRGKLVHDALNLAYGGKLRFDSALNVTRFLIHERDPIVWTPAFNLFDHILRQLEGYNTAIKFQEYLKVILTPAYESLVNRSGPYTAAEERMLSSGRSALCAAGYPPCVAEARRAWKMWMISDQPDAGIPITLSHFCWVFKFGTKEEWEFGLERYLRFPNNVKLADRNYLLKSLVSCPNSSSNVERLLNMTILGPTSETSDENVRTLLASLSSEVGYTALFHLLEDNWDTVRTRYDTKESRLWENIISTATMNFKTQDGFDMVSDLSQLRQREFGTATPIVEQALRRIKKQIKWSEDNGVIIDQWLDLYLSRSRG